jgi:[pyruvate, water dikinase]-phosphate phosphotransferase / [pyruvate, water dikinase] kinase
MDRKYNVFLVSDSTGETLDRIFLALKAQFENFNNNLHHFSFVRTEAQIATLLEKCNKLGNPIVLYTLVEPAVTAFLIQETEKHKIPCFGVLDYLIPKFETALNRKANRKPSGQHILNKEYYKKIAAMQFSIEHDDGQKLETILEADIIILGISRTSKTPTTIYLANRGYKSANIPMVPNQKIPEEILKNKKKTIVGLIADPERLVDIRKNRLNTLSEEKHTSYVDLERIKEELEESRKVFKANNIPTIDVTRKSVEETAASIIILASASGIRLKILNDFSFNVKVEAANIDEDEIKNSLLAEKFSSFDISRALAETKAKKISSKFYGQTVLGADQVLDFEGNIFNKPENMELAISLMKKLNGKEHSLFSSICLSKNGSTIWMYTEKAVLKMRQFSDNFIKDYLQKVGLETIKKYGVYQIEGMGKDLFEEIKGDEYSVMGMPIKQLINYYKLNEK